MAGRRDDGEGRETLRLRTPFVPALDRVVSPMRDPILLESGLAADEATVRLVARRD